MKKRLTLIILLLLLATSVEAMIITLGGPTGTQTTSTINFGCTVTATGEELQSLSLWHNIGGTFHSAQTNTTAVTEGTEYTFTETGVANGNYEWNCRASNATDSIFATSNNSFTVNVPTNNPPVWTAIPTQTWPETESKTITLSDYFSDPDGDTLTYTSNTPSNIAVSISGATATLTPQNWHGTTTITFTADDSKGGQNSTTANLNVTHVNRPPYAKTNYMSNETWTQNEERRIELDDYFADYDGDTLTYSSRFSSGGTHHVNITIDNSTAEAIMAPETDWKGIERVVFTAYDGQGGSLDSNEVTLTVKAGTKINHAPTTGARSPLVNPILTVGNSQKFTIEPEDEDLDDLTIKWFIDSEEQTASRNKENYTFLALSEGTYAIKVTVSDGEFTESENWTVNVQGIGGTPQQPEILETPAEPTNLCGNGQVNSGETCSTCPQDVQCPPGYECKNNKCTKEVKKSNLTLILIVGGSFIAFAAITLFVYRWYKKRTLFGGWKPKYTGDTTNVQLAVKPKEEQPVQIQGKREIVPKMDSKKKTVNEILLKHYIESGLKRGETIEKIKEKLKKVGWSDEKIDEAYKAAELDETFNK